MWKRMTGQDEVKNYLTEIKEELPIMRETIMQGFREDMKNEFNSFAQALEIRNNEVLEELRDEIISKLSHIGNANNVVTAIEDREEKKEIEGNKQIIISNLSRVYAMEKETELLTQTNRGTAKLTSEGQKVYDLFSQTVMDIAKLNGSKSHMKVANRTTYTEFMSVEKIPEELRKEPITLVDGSARESVYADIIKRRKLGKFAKFIEEKYVLNV